MELKSIETFKEFLQSGNFKLKPTQRKLCFPIIKRIYNKMKVGVEFGSINVMDDLLINGHHRYICSLLLQRTIKTNLWQSPSNIIIQKWSEIEVDPEDWESIDIIKRHNLKDAAISGLNIKVFEIRLEKLLNYF